MSVKERLIQCLENIGVFLSDSDIDLSNLISDSLMYVSMIIEIEQEFQIEIPDDYLFKDKLLTFSDLEKMVYDVQKQHGIKG